MYTMILWWWVVIRTQWWLRSTTGPYGRSVIEVAYGKWYLHSTEAVWEMIVREEWLECQHDASPMFDIPGSTPVWASYILFFDFLNIKTYVYVYYFQNLYIVSKNIGGLWPRPHLINKLIYIFINLMFGLFNVKKLKKK